MKIQEVITIFSDIPFGATMKTYPELDEWLEKGMYVEQFQQTQSDSTSKYVITFVLRYFNVSTSGRTE